MENINNLPLFQKMYGDNKKTIDGGLTRYINKLAGTAVIRHGSVYSLTFPRDDVIKGYVLYHTKNLDLSVNKDELLLFNKVLNKIIGEHFKTKAVNRFGLNGRLCFEIKNSIHKVTVFFKILP
jgi:hypothetical protein